MGKKTGNSSSSHAQQAKETLKQMAVSLAQQANWQEALAINQVIISNS